MQDTEGATDEAMRTLWEELLYSPILLLARIAHDACTPRPLALIKQDDPQMEPSPERARIVCISDTHSRQADLPSLPPGDVLIHAGDLTNLGSRRELNAAFAWLHAAPHPHKIVIAGNHDSGLARRGIRDELLAEYPSITYLKNTLTTIEVRGRLLSVYGSPYTPWHEGGEFSYNHSRAPRVWNIPPLIDILVTHGPPKFHLDSRGGKGCEYLLRAVEETRPLLHVFGHLHSGRGVKCVAWDEGQRKYEAVSFGKGRNALGALWLVAAALGTMVRGRPKFSPGGHTMFVNASSQGWFKDPAWRGATVVDIPLSHRS
ncbi:metallophosphoesterase domain-containing protein 1 [Polyporus arcularius HHB13444]|uniref:Metallophosphoesterase domain-containing protein 1 n=1 Tax=Polyporus arcularius HHB13444 TaxID=1314778 RepID=A0A5C3P8H1_9APHY|nr:metallophosphoesterase domain-containing protein 1 [Polyporus arcularius HHB13444]